MPPREFRRSLRLSCEPPLLFRDSVQPWQEVDFAALDPSWQKLAGLQSAGVSSARQTIQRAYIERPRGHGKTSDMAMQIAWILLAAQHPVHGLAAAADREQALLIHNAVRKLSSANSLLCDALQFRQHRIINLRTGGQLEIISSDVQSSWGQLPDFVICDELCHWDKPQLWYSLLSSAAKRPDSILVVLTNAGVGRGWHWDVREAARLNPRWHFSSLDGVQAPWIRDEHLDEQRQLLPPPVYDRLWNNRWQHSDGEFVTLKEAEACRDDSLQERDQGESRYAYVAAIDYAEKHDFTVGVVIHEEQGRVVVDRMDVVAPSSGNPTPVAWVDRWMENIAASFRNVQFVLDEYQLLGTIQKYERSFNLQRFEFLGGRGNHALTLHLRNLIVQRGIVWYPGCGAVTKFDGQEHRDDLETELASLLLKQSTSGLCRIDHLPDGRHHDDRAFALGAACLHLARRSPPGEWMHISQPGNDGGFGLLS